MVGLGRMILLTGRMTHKHRSQLSVRRQLRVESGQRPPLVGLVEEGDQNLLSPAKKWIMRQSLGLMLFISNPWT
jgi:hypothetical protein